ncbi:Ig-like domain repeat protein [Subtercola endophyticus]|nr:Ig-like domain repeat protein [Subtercola endophyticus]
MVVAPIYPTVTTVSVSPDPSLPSDDLTATVHVQSTSGAPATGGTVQLQIPGRAVLSATVAAGTASFALDTLPVGDTTLTATYSGVDTSEAVFQASSASATHTVTPFFTSATATLLSSTPNPALRGDTVTFTAEVRDTRAEHPNGGTVTFTARPQFSPSTVIPLGTASVVNGFATVAYPYLAPTVYQVTAAFSGFTSRTEIFQPSTSSPLDQTVEAITMPVVVAQPQSATIVYGDQPPVLRAAAVSNPDPASQWQVSADTNTPFTDIPGATAGSYQPPADTPSGTRFRVLFSNGHGTTQSNIAVLTVTKARLVVTADDKTMAFGTEAPEFTASYGAGDEGFRLGDGPGSLQGTLLCSTSLAAGPDLPAGRYAITCTGQSSPHYDIDYRPGTLVVAAAAQVITFTSDAPDLAHVGDVYSAEATGGASGQPVVFQADASSASWCTVAPDGLVSFASDVSTPFAGTCTVYADQAGSGLYPPAERVSQTIAVEKYAPAVDSFGGRLSIESGEQRTLRVTASGNPEVRYQWYSSRDDVTYTAIPLAQSSQYVVHARVSIDRTFYKALVYNATGDTPSEGRVFSAATFVTVTPTPIEVLAPDVSMEQGSAPPTITPEYSPFIGSDTPESLGLTVTCTVDATPATPAGTYPDATTCSGFSNPDYAPYYVAGTLTVQDAAGTTAPGDPGGGAAAGGSGSGSGASGGGSPPADVTAGSDGTSSLGGHAQSLAATGRTAPPLSLLLLALSAAAFGTSAVVFTRARRRRTP